VGVRFFGPLAYARGYTFGYTRRGKVRRGRFVERDGRGCRLSCLQGHKQCRPLHAEWEAHCSLGVPCVAAWECDPAERFDDSGL
jgi:hypothetical protein